MNFNWIVCFSFGLQIIILTLIFRRLLLTMDFNIALTVDSTVLFIVCLFCLLVLSVYYCWRGGGGVTVALNILILFMCSIIFYDL